MRKIRADNLKCSSLIQFEIIYILYIKLFIDVVGIPNAAWYLCDIINITLLFWGIRKKKIFNTIGASGFLALIGIIFFFSLCGFVLNSVSVSLYLWGLRNIGRMFVFWFVCIAFLKWDDLIRILRCFYVAYIVNFFLSILQYVGGIKGDNLGGIFGISGASSAYSLNLLVIVSMLALCGYLERSISLSKMIVIVLMAMILAPLAELKAYYILFIAFALIAMVMKGNLSWRVLVIVLGGIIGIYIAYRIMLVVYPESLTHLTIQGMQEYLGGRDGIGYSSVGDLSRTRAISQLYYMFFKGDTFHNIFGFGLGSCETSTFAFLNSSFYQQYEYLHYRWFFDAMLYLEMGIGGLILFALFGIMILIYIQKNRPIFPESSHGFVVISTLMVVYAFVLAVYNSSLRIESGYLLWFMLSFPFILIKSKDDESKLKYKDIFFLTKKRILIV